MLAVVWSATAAYFDLGYPPFATALAGLAVATYAFAAYEAPRPAPLRSIVVAALGVAVVAIAVRIGYSAAEGTAIFLVFGTVWVMGARARTRRQYLESLEERCELLAAVLFVLAPRRPGILPRQGGWYLLVLIIPVALASRVLVTAARWRTGMPKRFAGEVYGGLPNP